MSTTIVAKSDQINAADLIGTSRTITVREVRIKPGDDQPVSILIEGDNKAFRPCKGVRRLLVRVWGADANKYVGQSMTLFCDPTVTWAGKEEGGIRISHMTGLSSEITEHMRVNRAGTKPYKIKPLRQDQRQQTNEDTAANWTRTFIANVDKAMALDELDALILRGEKNMAGLQANRPELHAECMHAVSLKRESFGAVEHQEGRTDEQHGDQFSGDEGDAS